MYIYYSHVKFSYPCAGNTKALFRRRVLAPVSGALVLCFVLSSSASAAIDLASITKTSEFDSSGDYFLSSSIENISLIVDDDGIPSSVFTTFSGTLNGNNFSISELNTPLFGNLDQATVSNLTLNTDSDGISIIGSAGILAATANHSDYSVDNSEIYRVKVTGTINAGGSNIGGLVGYSSKTSIAFSEANVIINYIEGTPGSVGGLVGTNDAGMIRDSKSQGTVRGYDLVGGIAGLNTDSGLIVNSSSSATVNGNGSIGGIVGDNNESSTIIGSKFDGTVFGDRSVGGIAGTNSGNVSQSLSSGSATAISYNAGGLVGYNVGGSIESSASSAVVAGPQTAGGLVGWSTSDGLISNSMAQGNVNGDYAVGGLVGRNDGDISNSMATGDVSESNLNSGVDIGGLVGVNFSSYSSVTNSIATGVVTGSGEIGGLIGYTVNSTITNSIATGNVNGISAIGGLIGTSDSDSISGTHASGDVLANSNRVGGLIGYAAGSYISSSTSTGDVTGDATVGGFIGYGHFATIMKSSSAGNVNGENYVGGFIADDAYNTITNSMASGNVAGVDYVGSFAALSSRGSVGGTTYPPVENSTSMGSTTGTGEHVGGFYGYRNQPASVTSRETTTQTDALTVVNNGLGVAAWEINPNSSLNYLSLIVNMNTVTMISILNKNLIAPKWGNNRYINGGNPYLIALLSSGFYSDSTPIPDIPPGPPSSGSGSIKKPISPEEIAKREGSERKILESLKENFRKIEVEDFKSAGIVGVTDKSLPIVVELLAELEIQTFEAPTVQKVVQIAGAISRIISVDQGKSISFIDLKKVGVTEIEYSELKEFSNFLALLPADKKNSIKEIQLLVAEFKKNKEVAIKAREAKKEATRIQREKNLQLILSMFNK
ncbi:GLUG [actinobacterium SCGC AAA044-D11]